MAFVSSLFILYEDDNFVIVNKPSGLLTQPDISNDPNNLLQLIQKKYKQSLYLVSRLDRPVSGIITIAKNQKSARFYSNLIKDGAIQKNYIAIVQNSPESNTGTLENWLFHDQKKKKAFISDKKSKKAKYSKLTYSEIGKTEHYTGLLVQLHTGRFHQIRAQLASIGCPIKGDVKYGARRSNKDRSIHLHAYSLAFKLPNGERMIRVQAKSPKEVLWNAIGEINPLILQDKVEIWKIKK
jgi:23S rRNA pseudouridine1911/1915/1917 synthase